MIDVNALIGPYPFRAVPHPDPDVLVRVLDREKIDRAWVGHLPSAFHRDPSTGNAELFAALKPHAAAIEGRTGDPARLAAMGTARSHNARDAGAVAVRAYPPQWQLGPHDASMTELAIACGEAKLPLVLTVKFEDLRQRHPLDVAGDLTAAAIRSLARAGEGVRLIVTAAGREMIEEVHWGLTPGGAGARALGHFLDLGAAGRSPRETVPRRLAHSGSCTARTGRCGSRRIRVRISTCCRTISRRLRSATRRRSKR